MWTRDQVLEASHAWKWVPPGAEELRIEDVVVIDYPDWAGMGFYAMPARVQEPERAVNAIRDAAPKRGRASTEWWVTPSTSPADLEAALIERGAVASDAADILTYDMSGGLPSIPVPDEVHAVVVTHTRASTMRNPWQQQSGEVSRPPEIAVRTKSDPWATLWTRRVASGSLHTRTA